ncbi:MAG: hypothetical protein AMJ79_15680 [Phycisphaerae bacterium SM23_30]|nr:MAG: hypothetical protein AMJ79_15680 [Phycisphaerae bacterium SM23_30]
MSRRSVLGSIWAVVILSTAPTWAAGSDQIKLLASDGAEGDIFGWSVALDGNVALVGSYGHVVEEAAYVFRYDGTNWVQEAKLNSPEGDYEFSHSLAIDKDVAAVASSGAVNMYRYQEPNWIQEARLDVPGVGISAVLMQSNLLALEGNVAVVGALFDDDAGDCAGAVYVFRYNGNSWQEEAKLFAADAKERQYFGCSVALDEDLIIVGASEVRTGPGTAYIFRYQDHIWKQEAKLTKPGGLKGDLFGHSVALCKQKALVGAIGTRSMSAYVFQYQDPNWALEAKLTAADVDWGDNLAASLVLTDEMALIGAPGNGQPSTGPGKVYIFRHDDTGWYEHGKVYAFDKEGEDLFGYSIALSGDRALVGARFNSELGKHAGAAYIFDASCIYNLTGDFNNDCRVNFLDYTSLGAQWLIDCRDESSNQACFYKSVIFEENKFQSHKLNTIDSFFGCSIAIFNDNAVIGAFSDNDYIGSAYIYQHNQGQWIEKQRLTPSVVNYGNYFGISVDIDDDIILVGNPGPGGGHSPPADPMIGSAYIFRYQDPNWIQESRLTASDAAPYSYFGDRVALEGNTAMAGAYGVDASTGAVYVFEYLIPQGSAEPNWIQTAKLTASDGNIYDNFGSSIALDGETLIIGSPYDDDHGDSSGSAYIFRYKGNTWTEQAKLTAADAAAEGNFGCSVAIDGNLAVIGATGDDDEGSGAGSAYVFQYQEPNWIQIAKLNPWEGESVDTFAATVFISDNYVLVSAKNNEDADNPRSIYVFKYDDGNWIKMTKLKASDGADDFNFGVALALWENTVIVGAPSDYQGSAYVFDLSCPYTLLSDIYIDSRVDLLDLALWTSYWLINCNINPAHPFCIPKYK